MTTCVLQLQSGNAVMVHVELVTSHYIMGTCTLLSGHMIVYGFFDTVTSPCVRQSSVCMCLCYLLWVCVHACMYVCVYTCVCKWLFVCVSTLEYVYGCVCVTKCMCKYKFMSILACYKGTDEDFSCQHEVHQARCFS